MDNEDTLFLTDNEESVNDSKENFDESNVSTANKHRVSDFMVRRQVKPIFDSDDSDNEDEIRSSWKSNGIQSDNDDSHSEEDQSKSNGIQSDNDDSHSEEDQSRNLDSSIAESIHRNSLNATDKTLDPENSIPNSNHNNSANEADDTRDLENSIHEFIPDHSVIEAGESRYLENSINGSNPVESVSEAGEKNNEEVIEGSDDDNSVLSDTLPNYSKKVTNRRSPVQINDISSSSEDSDVEIVEEYDSDYQPDIEPEVVIKKEPLTEKVSNKVNKENVFIEVSQEEYNTKKQNVQKLGNEVIKLANMIRTLNLSALPDNGASLIKRHKSFDDDYRQQCVELQNMVIKADDAQKLGAPPVVGWNDIQEGAGGVLPKTFGKQAMATYNANKALTLDALQNLHSSLEKRPQETDFISDPKNLKVELMPHQRHGVAWLLWREQQKPSGGILADDMGLGKTLTIITLVLKTNELHGEDQEDDVENQKERSDYKYKGGTLIVCPASLLEQWSGEIDRRLKKGTLSYDIFHGPRRETKPKRLANYDIVITTYATANVENLKNGVLNHIKWRRVVLDEAHQVRNHKSQTNEAVCNLSAKSRWALTGTPVQNKEMDMFALMKFLRCKPFDDIQVWKNWVGAKSIGGPERLQTVIASLLLRRTKAELMEKGALQSLPNRTWELISVNLHPHEKQVYQKFLLFSQTLFAQYLHQRAEKEQETLVNTRTDRAEKNQAYVKMREKLLKLNKLQNVGHDTILVLLLRLRQMCNHPCLIRKMLQEGINDDLNETDKDIDLGENDTMHEGDLMDQLNNLKLDDDDESVSVDPSSSNEGSGKQNIFNVANPVFSEPYPSSKIKVVLDILKEKILSTDDKAIIVSQWTSYLKVVAFHLRQERIKFGQLDGTVLPRQRMAIVDKINDQNDDMKILLLSLTAGGVGLNLVGANHLLLLDLHWNPQLENQAQDRIYRMGQNKPVFVYKFMAADTIEVRIKSLQDMKLNIADTMLTGTKHKIQSKLTLQDLRALFDM